MLDFDLSKLVSETLALSERNQSIDFAAEIPECPGVIFEVHQTPLLFVVKMECSENLSLDWPRENNENLHYFECDNIKLAQALKATISHKRFPRYEEYVFNISDHSNHWWLDIKDEYSFQIYFKLTNTHRLDHLTKLGPLGDSSLAQRRLAQFRNYFSKLFALSEYNLQSGQWSVSIAKNKNTPNQLLIFKQFCDLWQGGGIGHEFWLTLANLEEQAQDLRVRESINFANYYLMELATIRRFWLTLEEHLKFE